jgi:hypothetical protein
MAYRFFIFWGKKSCLPHQNFGRKMFPIEFRVKDQFSSALDIEVEIWFQGSRVTLYHTYGLPMGCKVPKILFIFLYPLRKEGIFTY